MDYGRDRKLHDGNAETLKNEVWSSADGRAWKLEVQNAGWSKRTHAQAVVHAFAGPQPIPAGPGNWRAVSLRTRMMARFKCGIGWNMRRYGHVASSEEGSDLVGVETSVPWIYQNRKCRWWRGFPAPRG